jgi:class 3 adenylate cyclase
VNTASRIEALTRDSPYHIIITKDTRDALVHPGLFSFNDLGETTLRGKNTPIITYGVDTFEKRELPGFDVDENHES